MVPEIKIEDHPDAEGFACPKCKRPVVILRATATEPEVAAHSLPFCRWFRKRSPAERLAAVRTSLS
jgi:ssDNA-binding Zn-finger/Zn-ribbon topoisomerase 1